MRMNRPLPMEGVPPVTARANPPAVLVIRPDPRGFLPRYLLALTPLVVLAISLVASAFLSGFVEGFTTSFAGPVRSVLAGLDEMIQVSVLLTAPVGIYVVFMGIGWKARVTELWAGSALALVLSALAGVLLVTISPDRTLSPLLDFLYRVAYLVPPATVLAVLALGAGAELFRRSITYTLSQAGIVTKGGIWKKEERIIPAHQVGELVLEQGGFARLLGIGTIIPIGTAAVGLPVLRKTKAAQVGKEASRHPLDCLYGIRDPEKVMALLGQLTGLPVTG